MKYDELILNDLMAIYEKRDANSSNFRTSIKLKLNKEKYPKYFEDVSGYDEAILSLLKRELIKVKYVPHDTVIDSIILNVDKVDDVKRILGIEGVSKTREKLLDELSKYDDKIIVNLRDTIINRINESKSIKQYLNDDFIDSLKAVHYIENLDHDVFERNASNYIYSDSKKLASLKTTINSIYGLEDAFYEKGIISVPPYLYVKGEGIITLNNEEIDLSKLKSSIGIPIDEIDTLSFNQITKVTTIENLTTFYDYIDEGIIIYLGGFSTRSQMKVLLKLKEVCNNFYHFGDIDFGGYTILNNLIESLNIEIKTVKMDLGTLKSNIKYAQKFDDDKYVERLKSLLAKPNLEPYHEVIQYLIDNHVWLEQESFYNV